MTRVLEPQARKEDKEKIDTIALQGPMTRVSGSRVASSGIQSILPHIGTIIKWFMKLSPWKWLHQAHDTSDAYMEGETPALEGPITRERLKRIQEEVLYTCENFLSILGLPKKSLIQSSIHGACVLLGVLGGFGEHISEVVKDGKAKDKGSGGGNYSDHNRSSQSSREERCERYERNKREERHERRDRREKDRMDELDMSKSKLESQEKSSQPRSKSSRLDEFVPARRVPLQVNSVFACRLGVQQKHLSIPHFPRNCKLEVYIDWGLKVEQIEMGKVGELTFLGLCLDLVDFYDG
ncbi:hypothetical protein CR513_12353, partial [Mucuna pruriens]